MTTEQIISDVENRLLETCDSFIVMGFTTDGVPFITRHRPTAKDACALNYLLDQLMEDGGAGQIEFETSPPGEDEDDEPTDEA